MGDADPDGRLRHSRLAPAAGSHQRSRRCRPVRPRRPHLEPPMRVAMVDFGRIMTFGIASMTALLAVDLPLGPRLPVAALISLSVAPVLIACAAGGARLAATLQNCAKAATATRSRDTTRSTTRTRTTADSGCPGFRPGLDDRLSRIHWDGRCSWSCWACQSRPHSWRRPPTDRRRASRRGPRRRSGTPGGWRRFEGSPLSPRDPDQVAGAVLARAPGTSRRAGRAWRRRARSGRASLPGREGFAKRASGRSLVIVRSIPVGAPFPDVSGDVVEAISVRRKRADGAISAKPSSPVSL